MKDFGSMYRRIAGPKESVSRLIVTLAMIMTVYFIVGVIFFESNQGLSLRDSIYFIMVTTTALGYGDIRPVGALDKSFTMIFALIGVGVIFVCLRRLVQLLVHQRTVALKKKREKKLMKADQKLKEQLGVGKSKLLGRVKENQKSVTTAVTVAAEKIERTSLVSLRRKAILKYPRLYRGIEIIACLWVYICAIAALLNGLKVLRPHQEFNGCIYFTIITGLTIGYGDVVPQPDSRWFMIFWVPFNIFVFSKALFMFDDAMRLKLGDPTSNGGGGGDDDNDDGTHPRDTSLMVDNLVSAAAAESGGHMTEVSYLRFMLVGSGICSPELMEEFGRRYTELDDHFGGHGKVSSNVLRESVAATGAATASSNSNKMNPVLASSSSGVVSVPSTTRDGVSIVEMNAF